MADYSRFDATEIKQWTSSVFERLGAPAEDARMTTEALIHADLMGIDSHGLNRAPNQNYFGGLKSGAVNAKAAPEIVHEAASTAVIDGQNGLGPVASTVAMDLAIAKARETGAGFVSIRGSNHYGAASHYSMMALPHDMIGISMTVGGLGVVATGGRGRRIGINPISVAAPARETVPFILDIATSVVAAGKLELAKMKEIPVPLGWIVDKDGAPTTDPNEYWKGGAILPLGGALDTGGHKGYGLSVMIDVLAGVLSGGGFAGELRETTPSGGTCHFQGALDIKAFIAVDQFKTIMDRMVTYLKATEPDDGSTGVMIHGERELAAEQERLLKGIPYHRDVVDRLRVLASEIDVPMPAPVGVEQAVAGAVPDVRLGEDDGPPVLLVDGTVQSVLADDPHGYWSHMVPNVRPRRALLLGLGAGTVARLLHDRFGDVPTVGVENDLAVVDFARELLRDLPALDIVHADAFEYVAQVAAQRAHFDYAAVDLYRGDQLVHGVVGRPFLRALRTLLEPRGLAAFNLFHERRVDDRLRRIGRLFHLLERRSVGKNLVVWYRA